ncbi:MAG: thioredoxin family protein [Polaribacter sp.]|nr:thioredoxin family protein [Polaribacter sp.]MDG1321578.1 thioredoxin family protein [Polaribacter sp.]
MKQLIAKSLENAISYSEYRTLVHDLLTDGKSTGPVQSEALTNYSLLNDRRMKRLDKTIKISNQTKAVFKSITEKQTWLVLSEGWCGDAAQNLPVIHKLATENKNITLKIILRDEHLAVMDLFLTNGGRSIPKVIVLDAENNVQHTWGPRPTLATKIMADYKAKKGSIDAQFKQDLQVWYNKNKGRSVQEDFVKMLSVL